VLSQPEPIEDFFGGCQTTTTLANGQQIGHKGYNGHPYDVPWGFKKLLHYVQATWTGLRIHGEEIPIYVTENGFAGTEEAGAAVEIAMKDVERQNYFEGYLRSLLEAVQEGVVIKGYFGWSLLE
jgi:beta-glucosidase